MEETGVVTKVEGVYATVLVRRKGACEHCTAGTCNMTETGAEIEALNEAGARAGQNVRVYMLPYTYVKGSFVFYGLPTMALIAGAIFGAEFLSPYFESMDRQAVSAITAFAAFGLSVLLVKLLARRAEKETRYKPVVREIIS